MLIIIWLNVDIDTSICYFLLILVHANLRFVDVIHTNWLNILILLLPNAQKCVIPKTITNINVVKLNINILISMLILINVSELQRPQSFTQRNIVAMDGWLIMTPMAK